MKLKRNTILLAFCSLLALPLLARADASTGRQAPDFTAADTAGKIHTLNDFRGKYLILEWINPGCPFVVKHYHPGNMQTTQTAAKKAGMTWVAVNSTNPAHKDYLQPAQLDAWLKKQKASPDFALMDADGVMGKAYGAKTTPHLYIIDPKGVLVYAGAIDSKASAKEEDIPSSTNYVRQAIQEIASGKPVSVPVTTPYGCSVKYKQVTENPVSGKKKK